jgi:hypothetical protein
MKLTATGGTDGANIVLYWPDQLPDDADARLEHDPVALIEQLEKDGKLVTFPCEGDGHYTVAVFVHEDPPPDLLKYCREHKTHPSISARGDGYFGGTEYVCKRDCAFREKYPHMSTKIAIPDGTYAATVYEVDAPEELESQWLLDHAGPAAVRISNAVGVIALAIGLCTLAALAGLAFMSWTVWLWIVGIDTALVATAWALARTADYRAVAAARIEFERAYPAYVLRLA